MDADTSPFSRTGLFGGGAQDDVIPLRGWGGSPAAAHPPLLRRADDVYAVVAAEPPRHQARGGGAKDSGMLSGTASGKLARVVCRSLEGELADGPGLPQRESGVL